MTPYEEGYEAGEGGYRLDNPYIRGWMRLEDQLTQAAIQWEKGYFSGRAQMWAEAIFHKAHDDAGRRY